MLYHDVMLIQWEGRIPGNAMGTVASHYSCNLTCVNDVPLGWGGVGSGGGAVDAPLLVSTYSARQQDLQMAGMKKKN